jgi:arylsulfatase A-like enzyme
VTVDVRCPASSVKKDGENLNWDHHDNIYTDGTCGKDRVLCGGEGRYGIATWPMMGSTDQAFAALISDMHDRGLLKETLVCFVTEFGRSPKMNKCHGRDHWPQAYSIAFAGAGVPGGQVIGATDKQGGEVTEKPHTPEDYAETIYAKLGITTGLRLKGPGERPVEFTDGGKPIPELF